MLTTVEVRWFHRESLPGAMLESFQEGPLVPGVEFREDRHLALPGCISVGVKLRNDRVLDIKSMRGLPRAVEYPNSIVGRSRTWVKWSAGRPFPRDFLSAIHRDGPEWVNVRKHRWIRRYALAGEEPEEAPHDSVLDAACDVEIVEITYQHSTEPSSWWSLAFEAFGAPDDGRLLLQRTAEHFFRSSQPPKALTAACSFSYPAWISLLTGQRT